MIGQGWDENLKFSSLSLFPQIDQNSKNEFLQVKKNYYIYIYKTIDFENLFSDCFANWKILFKS